MSQGVGLASCLPKTAWPSRLQQAARAGGIEAGCKNPFKSIIVRAVETVYAIDHALEIIERYEPSSHSPTAFRTHEGTGYGCTEAPRGILYHRYRFDAAGNILFSKIVPPTSQNQKVIESDLRGFVETNLDLPEEQLTKQCEQIIRNYDPCISCATHFLKLHVDRK